MASRYVEISRKEFEAALPKMKNGTPIWKFSGIHCGELLYSIQVPNLSKRKVEIVIRSSIDSATGVTRAVAKDSIKLFLKGDTGHYLSNKNRSYVQRTNGWERRIMNEIRGLYTRGSRVVICPQCGEQTAVFKAVTEANKGRAFRKCRNNVCEASRGFPEWLQDKEGNWVK